MGQPGHVARRGSGPSLCGDGLGCRFRGGRIRSIKCFYDSATMALVTGQARPSSDVADAIRPSGKPARTASLWI